MIKTPKRLIILSGAGISAESGISTFRDSNGLWRNHRIEEVASPRAWAQNPELVLEFYNIRRKQLFEAKPNAAHLALTRLEEKYKVQIITQNVDDLHERAGSSEVLHLHGELKKARSTRKPNLVYTLDHWELKMGDTCEQGAQLRPHVVWFGESVPLIEPAIALCSQADLLIVIGTSLQVYPAAQLIHYAPSHCSKYLIDPQASAPPNTQNLQLIREKASQGVPQLVDHLLKTN